MSPSASSAHRGSRALDVGEAERGEPFLGRLAARARRCPRGCRAAARRTAARGCRGPRAWCSRCSASKRSSAVRSGAVAVAEHPRQARCARARRTGACASVARRRAGGGARRCGGTRYASVESVGVGDGRRSRRPRARCSASSVVGDRTRLVVAAVHELQQLHRELDVADAAAAALELAVGEALALRDLLRPVPSSPGSRGGRRARARRARRTGAVSGHERGAEVAVAGDRSGLEQRLELPRAAPTRPSSAA